MGTVKKIKRIFQRKVPTVDMKLAEQAVIKARRETKKAEQITKEIERKYAELKKSGGIKKLKRAEAVRKKRVPRKSSRAVRKSKGYA
jgi:hypothetical protein